MPELNEHTCLNATCQILTTCQFRRSVVWPTWTSLLNPRRLALGESLPAFRIGTQESANFRNVISSGDGFIISIRDHRFVFR